MDYLIEKWLLKESIDTKLKNKIRSLNDNELNGVHSVGITLYYIYHKTNDSKRKKKLKKLIRDISTMK